MKRLIGGLTFSVALLVGLITAAVAMAAPAPKTTGDIGYTAYSDVQRNLTFNAIQANTNTCGTFWNVTGVSQMTFRLTGDTTDYTHHVALTQNGECRRRGGRLSAVGRPRCVSLEYHGGSPSATPSA